MVVVAPDTEVGREGLDVLVVGTEKRYGGRNGEM